MAAILIVYELQSVLWLRIKSKHQTMNLLDAVFTIH